VITAVLNAKQLQHSSWLNLFGQFVRDLMSDSLLNCKAFCVETNDTGQLGNTNELTRSPRFLFIKSLLSKLAENLSLTSPV